MKNIRVLGIDDAYFVPHKKGETYIVGVVMRLTFYVEGFMLREIAVDGMDVTKVLTSMINESKYRNDIKIVMTQGITFGGFNILDLHALHESTGKPIIVVLRKMPDIESMVFALKSHFHDWRERAELLKKVNIEKVKNGRYDVYIQRVGIEKNEAIRIIRKSTIRGAIPEPIRVAHLFASSLKLGESRGKP